MPSEFDELVRDLAKLRSRSAPPPPPVMRKSIEQIDLKRAFAQRGAGFNAEKIIGDLNLLVKSIGARIEANRADMEGDARTRFFKSHSAVRVHLGKAIREGRISADDAVRAEARLNRMMDQARDIVARESAQ